MYCFLYVLYSQKLIVIHLRPLLFATTSVEITFVAVASVIVAVVNEHALLQYGQQILKSGLPCP